jgi:hypothetical protein
LGVQGLGEGEGVEARMAGMRGEEPGRAWGRRWA